MKATPDGMIAARMLVEHLGLDENLCNVIGLAFDGFAQAQQKRPGRPSNIKVGDRFHRLTVIGRSEFYAPKVGTSQPAILWVVRCDCGTEKIVRANNLRSGNTRSCGCMNRERTSLYHALRRALTTEEVTA